MTTSTIHLPPELRAEITAYLVKQHCYDHSEQAEADNDATLLDTYNNARQKDGLPERIFTMSGACVTRREQEPWQEV